ncbi:hypothetical protein CPB97_000064 [Podila verticillata]|nr:hypothetical protein CPB97_000064 [Podila verticillata]
MDNESHVRWPLQEDHDDDGIQQQQQQQPPRYQEQQHYNIMIPTLDQWPQLALEGIAKGTAMVVEGVTTAHTKLQAYRAQHPDKSSYQGLASSSSDLYLSPRSSSSSSSPSFSSRRDPCKQVSFGGKRQLKRGVAWTVFLPGQLPQALIPSQETLWVRYYNHEEPVKVALPLGRKVHVSDVEAAAMTAISTDLYDFLDLQLGCFSRNSNMDITSKRFVPPGEDWTVLVEVIDLLNQNKVCKLMRAHIGYLRQGFSNPRPMGPYNMEAINNHRKSRHSGYMTPYRDGIRDPMASWAMHDDGGVAPKTNQNWTPKDKELTREISRQEDLGNMENAQELMDELNMKNRENGIDDQYPNPFQQPPRQHTSSQQQHYSILIPTVDHWPRIALEGLARGAVYALDALSYAQHTLHAHVNQLRANSSSSSYHVLPTSSADLHELSSPSSSPPHRRRIITFGSKRQQKESGYRVLCSSRRWTRLLAALTLFVLFITLLALPRRMNPFRSRTVWVRYYNHEEPVKIVLPFGRKVHVSDVKATAMKAMAFGYERPLGQVKLLLPYGHKLFPGDVWDDDMGIMAEAPIIAVETGFELFEFLNSNLNCFTSYPSSNLRFKPEQDQWFMLYDILDRINSNRLTFDREDIYYLRKGFDDPQANEPIWDMRPFNSKQRNHMGYDHPRYAPTVSSPIVWMVPRNHTNMSPDADPEEFQ